MTKVDIISGFLGAGKTTLIKKLLGEALSGEQVVLIENEFGEIGIDGGFLRDAGVEIREMNSGCICCSLVGDFGASLKEVIDKYHPDRIIIEPSGVGKLSDVIQAVKDLHMDDEIHLNSASAVVDALKCKVYMKNFGEFFNNQIESANTIILSRTQNENQEKLEKCIELIRKLNAKAHIITTPWEALEGVQILAAMENATNLELELLNEQEEQKHKHHDGECGCGHDHKEHEHHHHDEECGCGHDHEEHEHHHHDESCGCGHDHEEHEHHHHDEACGCGHDHEEHEHHHHEEECGCGHEEHEHDHHDHHDNEEHEHEHKHHDEECGHDHKEHDHHHQHDEKCGCGHDHKEHEHHHHDADEVFQSWGVETPNKYDKEELIKILHALSETDEYGQVLRSKGMIPQKDGSWMYFDLVPGEYEVREGKPDFTGRICVIGANLEEEKLKEIFNII